MTNIIIWEYEEKFKTKEKGCERNSTEEILLA